MSKNIMFKKPLIAIIVILLVSSIFVSADAGAGSQGSWDVSARFDAARFHGDYNKIYIWGHEVKTGMTHYARLNGSSDDTYETPTRYCAYDNSHHNYPNGWSIEREAKFTGGYSIIIRGASEADCGKGQPQNTGVVVINPDSGWEITKVVRCSVSKDRPDQGLIETYCDIDNLTGTIRWQSGSSCGGCCLCPGGAGVSIEVIVEKNLTDLSLTQKDIKFSNQNPSKGESITITVTVHNEGEVDKSDILIRFYKGDPREESELIGEDIIPFIGAKTSGIAAIGWSVSEEDANIYAVIDPMNKIIETDETNNEAFRKLEVKTFEYTYLILIFIVTLIICIALFTIYRNISYKKPTKDNINCPRCDMILPRGTAKCPVCGYKLPLMEKILKNMRGEGVKKLEGASTYLIEEREPKRCIEIFLNETGECPGLWISRTNPDQIKKEHNLQTQDISVLWLTDSLTSDESISSQIPQLFARLVNFIGVSERRVILLGGD